MDIYHGIQRLDKFNHVVIALGNFDGVHIGHRELIRRTREIAGRENGTPAVFTFDPHPMKVLQPDCCPPMLLTKKEKIRFFSDLGIKLLVVTPFSDRILKLSPREFVRDILVENFKAGTVVVGYNYSFGYRGSGDAELLAELAGEYGIYTVVVPPVKCGEAEVSSTLIRRFLLEGNVSKAAQFLGYYPFIVSCVVSGDRRGRQLGFPTANLNLPDDVLVPANGVYAVRTNIDERIYTGVANIGTKPTFNLNQPKNLEIHCFNFCGDIYNKEIKVEFIKRIRGECEFASAEHLADRIRLDITEAKQILDASSPE